MPSTEDRVIECSIHLLSICSMSYRPKYNQEFLVPIVLNSFSVSEVLRKLGLKPTGSNHRHITEAINSFGISKDHFLLGGDVTGRLLKRPWQEILVFGKKIASIRLRRAMLESGIPELCSECNLKTVWRDRRLTLQIDHIDGDVLNNSKDNLRFLCPNCHSQTDTYCRRKSTAKVRCLGCEKLIKRCKTGKCHECYSKYRPLKVVIPDREDLLDMVWKKPCSALAKEFGVSDKTIEAWCKKRGIPKPGRGYWSSCEA